MARQLQGNHPLGILLAFGIAIILATAFFSTSHAALAGGPDPTSAATVPAGPATTETASTQPISSPAENGAHPPEELWNLHFQNTDVFQGYPAFPAKYSGPNSLPRGGQIRESVSIDVMAGLRLWSGAEAHIDGLMWQGFGLANTFGVEGFPNGEAYRIGTQVPNGTIARLFIRQTIGLGGEQEDVADDQYILAGKRDVSRLTFTLGRFSAGDIFDTNAYANDARTQFMNWALINDLAWDYPADTIGYITGLAVELNQPKWTLRYGFFEVPSIQNGMAWEDGFLTWPYHTSSEGPADSGPLFRSWGMVVEYEQRYDIADHPGAIRFLAFLNKANMANYSQATAILLAGGPGADISAARKYRYKYGFAVNLEQEIMKNVGIFSRLGWNDGQEQSYMFNDVDYTGSLGLSIKGEGWHRPDDTVAIAGVINGISHAEKDFFRAGGLGILAGDGTLNYGLEKIMETYYDYQVWKGADVTFDYQFIADPAFNRDRGPVSVFGIRLHFEF